MTPRGFVAGPPATPCVGRPNRDEEGERHGGRCDPGLAFLREPAAMARQAVGCIGPERQALRSGCCLGTVYQLRLAVPSNTLLAGLVWIMQIALPSDST